MELRGIGFDGDGVQKLFLDKDPNAIIGGVRKVHGQIRLRRSLHCQLHYTEWSTSYSPRDPVHDSYISAPYILSKLKGSEGLPIRCRTGRSQTFLRRTGWSRRRFMAALGS